MTIPRFCIDEKMREFREHRPENIRPKMSRIDRAKQFAPFAALGSMDRVLAQVEKTKSKDEIEHVPEMADLDAMMLSAENMQDIFDIES